jgi:predicted component of type VI protein secretion system
MKAKLVFELPAEVEEFRTAADAGKLLRMIQEMQQYLRKRLKYEELSPEEHATLTEVQKHFCELLQDHEVGWVLG